jgi:phosphohistidine phosphatase
MILYIVRHAIAEDLKTNDESRELTREGIEKMKKAAAGLRALDAVPEVMLTSPLVRARQTAEILVNAFQGKPGCRQVPALAPAGDRAEVYREILRHGQAASVMLVGHQPSLGEIAGEIAFGSPAAALELKKGGACAIEIERLTARPRGSLLWLATPALLRKLCSGT